MRKLLYFITYWENSDKIVKISKCEIFGKLAAAKIYHKIRLWNDTFLLYKYWYRVQYIWLYNYKSQG